MHLSQHTHPSCPKKNGVGEWELDRTTHQYINNDGLKDTCWHSLKRNTSLPSLCFLCMHAAEGVGTGRMAHPPLLCEV